METLARILVVDDDHDISTSLRLVLEHAGYEVREAASADEAFDTILQWAPDLILLDVMMPDATEGFHLVWKLRGRVQPPISEIPIIIHSVIHATTDLRFYPSIHDPEYAPGEFLPVQAFLDKPAPLALLLREVRSNLRKEVFAN